MNTRTLVVPHNGAMLLVEFKDDATRSIMAGKVVDILGAPPAPATPVPPKVDRTVRSNLPEAFAAGLTSARSEDGACQTAIDDAIRVRHRLKGKAGQTLPLAANFRRILPKRSPNAIYRAAAYGHHMKWWEVTKEPGHITVVTIAEAE